MFLNKSVQTPHHKLEPKLPAASPNYVGLVKFLVQPFLESPESLSVDCEMSYTLKRAWIRIAFDPTDKGKVFGRIGWPVSIPGHLRQQYPKSGWYVF
jgi:predicted RNA-binding protein YlqC (UPF0109 family)